VRPTVRGASSGSALSGPSDTEPPAGSVPIAAASARVRRRAGLLLAAGLVAAGVAAYTFAGRHPPSQPVRGAGGEPSSTSAPAQPAPSPSEPAPVEPRSTRRESEILLPDPPAPSQATATSSASRDGPRKIGATAPARPVGAAVRPPARDDEPPPATTKPSPPPSAPEDELMDEHR
jgi:hypothetical protein